LGHAAVVDPADDVWGRTVLPQNLDDLRLSFRFADAMTADDELIAVSSAKRRVGFRMKWSRHGDLLLELLGSSPHGAAAASASAPIIGSEKYGVGDRLHSP
jgi:hypothetical protein